MVEWCLVGVDEHGRVAASPGIVGVANLRGRVIPVLCLRRRFHMPIAEAPIVVVVESDTGLMGLAVDRVQDVAAIAEAQLESPPKHGMPIDATYIYAIAKDGDHIRIILDINRTVDLGTPPDR